MGHLTQFSDELESLVARLAPSVIGVESQRSQGSGMVLAQDGYLLTNRHVVEGKRELKVRYFDGERDKVDVVGMDAATDLAVLRASRRGVNALPLASREQVRPGQLVVALGDPFWFERSLSLGVVSALERRLPGNGVVLDGLVQTDAAINPGNSGGPLVNTRGQVVGINTAILPFAQGIGFAVPAWTASWVATLLLQHGEIRRRYLGIAARSETFTEALAAATGQPQGVRILQVGDRSPAREAGLSEEDVILALNGQPVWNIDDLQRLAALAPDWDVRLDIWRKGERRQRYVQLAKQARAA